MRPESVHLSIRQGAMTSISGASAAWDLFSMALAGVIAQRLVPRIGGGRVAAYEVLVATTGVANLIREGKVRQVRNIIATGVRDGMCVMEQSLGALIGNGVITLDEALAVSVHPEDIAGLNPHLGLPSTAKH